MILTVFSYVDTMGCVKNLPSFFFHRYKNCKAVPVYTSSRVSSSVYIGNSVAGIYFLPSSTSKLSDGYLQIRLQYEHLLRKVRLFGYTSCEPIF